MKSRSILATGLTFLLALAGCERAGEQKMTLGTHTLIIADTSPKKPLGGTLGTGRDDVAGTVTHYFDSANGRYQIQLEDGILTINGEKCAIAKPGSEIRIVDGRVEINGVAQGKPVPPAPPAPNAKAQETVDKEDASRPPLTVKAWTEAHNRWPTDIDWRKVPANESLEVFLHEYKAPEIKGHRASPNLSDWDFEGASFGNSLGDQGYQVKLHYRGTKSGKDYYDLDITHPEGDGPSTTSRRLIYDGAGVEVFRDDKYRICIQPRSAALQWDQAN
jgi:hypothetical protein